MCCIFFVLRTGIGIVSSGEKVVHVCGLKAPRSLENIVIVDIEAVSQVQHSNSCLSQYVDE